MNELSRAFRCALHHQLLRKMNLFVLTQCEDSAAAALSHISKLQVRHLILLAWEKKLNAGVDVTQPNVFFKNSNLIFHTLFSLFAVAV